MANLQTLRVHGKTNFEQPVYSKEFVGNLSGVAEMANMDILGNAITSYYMPKCNLIQKGDATTPVYIDENGVAQPVSFSVDANSKLTDTVTTVVTEGEGNAITSLVDDGYGALTATKDLTFLTGHPAMNVNDITNSVLKAKEGDTLNVVSSVERDEFGHLVTANIQAVTLPTVNWTDTKVTQTILDGDTFYRPIILGASTTGNNENTLQTDQVYVASGIYANATDKSIYASNFVGNLKGTADRAITDKDGNDFATKYAPIISPALSGRPTAPTAISSVNDDQIATTAFVHNLTSQAIEAADAMIYKGTLGTKEDNATYNSLPAGALTGWTLKVISAGTYNNQACEVGDILIALGDDTWTVVQNNIDGAVVSPSSAQEGNIVIFKGDTGRMIKDSGFTIATSVPENAVFTDVRNTVGATHNDNKIFLVGTELQDDIVQSYTNINAYVENNELYSKGSRVVTDNDLANLSVSKADSSAYADESNKATFDANDNNIAETYMPISGGAFRGNISLNNGKNKKLDEVAVGERPTDASLNAANADIVNLSALIFATESKNCLRSIAFPNSELSQYTCIYGNGTGSVRTDLYDVENKTTTDSFLAKGTVEGVGTTTLPVYMDNTGTLQTVTSYEGNSASATNAENDANGNNIIATYETISNVASKGNATLPIYFDENGVANTITSYGGQSNSAINDSDGKAINTTYEKKVDLAGKGNSTTPVYFDTNGVANTITSYSGNSASATKATQDADGNVITTTYETKANVTSKGTSTLPVYFDADGVAQTITSYEGKADTAGVADSANAVAWTNVSGKPVSDTYSADSSNLMTGKAIAQALSEYTTSGNSVNGVSASATNGNISITKGTTTTDITAYTLPVASTTLGGVKTTSTVSNTEGLIACPIISGIPYYQDTLYSTGTGLSMSGTVLSNSGVTSINSQTGDVTLNVPTVSDTYSATSTDAMSGKAVASAVTGAVNSIDTGVASINGKTGIVTLDIPAEVTSSTVSGWGYAKTSDLATSSVASATKSTQDADGNVITSTYATKTELKDYAKLTDISSVYKYKGSVTNYSNLPTSNQTVGDVYNVENADTTQGIKAGDNVAWNGSAWDVLSGTIDLSAYATTESLANATVSKATSADSATKAVQDGNGNVISSTYLTSSSTLDATKLSGTIPSSCYTDTNTHYASKNVVGSSTSTSNTTSALTNGNVYLNSVENGVVTSAHKISGSGATTVTTDTSGNIVISSTDNNTVYTHPTATAYNSGLYKVTVNETGHITSATAVTKADITGLGIPASDTNTTYSAGTGLSLNGTTINHSNSVTASTAGTSSATSGATLAVPYVTYDAQGHITASGTHTHTISGFATSNTTYSAGTGLSLSGTTFSNSGVTSFNGQTGAVSATIPVISAGTTDLTAGTSSLASGAVYLVYE